MPKDKRTYHNPIWSIERALRHGYVMEPHTPSGDFSGPLRMSRPSHDCALVKAQINRDMRDPTMKDQHRGRPACERQCDECASICHMNDYTRAKPHCPPNYPMPAIPLIVLYTLNGVRIIDQAEWPPRSLAQYGTD